MHVPDRRAAIQQVLGELSGLAPAADRSRLADLAERLRGGRLRVLVAGEAKRGKSTVVNALIGRDLLPSGVTPVTAVTTTVVYGTDEHVAVDFAGGGAERRPFADLAGLVTERGNPGNRLGVARVTVHVAAPLLARGVEMVDTPGTGSVYEQATAEAERAIETLDAAVMVLTGDPPASATERELLRRIAGRSVMTFVLLNKADRLDAADRAEALAFAADVVRAAAGDHAPLYAVSARAALTGRHDDGFAAFTADFAGYLDAGRAADLEQSVAWHARGIAQRLLDEVRLTRRAAEMRTGQAARRVAEFRERLTTVGARRQDAVDLVEAESRRLLSGLNEAAEQEAGRLAAEVRSGLKSLLTGELAGATPAAIEERGIQRLADRARAGADAWRDRRRQRLEDSLARLDTRLLDALNAELAEIRDAARDLLDLELAMPETGERLITDPHFFYVGPEISGQTELLAGAVRRRLPGELGRRRARAHVLAAADDLANQLVGRARSDLQYRLEESSRRLAGTVDERYAGSIGRLVAVVDSAVADSGRAGTDAHTQERDLAGREETLLRLRAGLRDAPYDQPAGARRASC